MSITKLNRIVRVVTLAATLCGTGIALAQTAPAPSLKTIGTPAAAAKPEIVRPMFVLNSRGAMLQGDTLTLTGVMPQGLRCLTIQLRETEIDMLICRALLKPEMRHNKNAIIRALHDHFDLTLSMKP